MIRAGWVVLSGVLTAGCGSAPFSEEQASTGGTGGGDGAGGSPDGAGGSWGTAANDPPDPAHGGIVQVFSGTILGDEEAFVGTAAMAFFFDAPGATKGALSHRPARCRSSAISTKTTRNP